MADAAWLPYTPNRTFSLSAGNGTKTVYAIFRDGANNQTIAVNDTIVLDTTPISTPFVTIQADATSSTTVTVNLAASNIDEMWLSESSTFATGAWEPYVGTKNVTFTAGDGVKTLYAKFKKTSGAESVVVSDSYILDTVGPILPSVRVNNGAAVVSSAIVTLNLSAVDSTSGLAVYRLNTVNDFALIPDTGYQTNDVYTLPARDGVKTLWVIYGDRAYNYSSAASVSVLLDTTAPNVGSVSVTKLDGTVLATGNTVRDGRIILASTVTDLTPLEMQVTTTGSFGGLGWEPYNPSKVIDLTAASSTISARVRDAAGHEADLVTGFIVNLDNAAPTATLTLTSATPTNILNIGYTVSSNESGQMQVSTDVGFAGATWEAVGSGAIALSAGDGMRSVYARVRDAAGNISDVRTINVILDQTPPQNASFTIQTGTYTNTRSVGLSYSGVEITEVRVAENTCSGVYASHSGSGMITIPSAGDGVKTIAVQFRDAVGNITACLTQTVTLDETPPVLGYFVINGNAASATVRSVTLGISVTDATEMQISESSIFTGASWMPVTAAVNITLSPGEGSKTVFARFRDQALNQAGPVQDSILLDTIAPELFALNGPLLTNSLVIGLSFTASGADEFRLSENGDFAGATWKPYAANVTFALSAGQGTKTVYTQLRDNAGNLSLVRSHLVTFDNSAPDAPSINIVGGAFTKVASVTVQTISGGAAEMKVSQLSDLSDATWVPFAQLKSYTLTGGEGTHAIYVKVRDTALNESGVATANVTLDSTPPDVNMRADDGLGNLVLQANTTRYFMRLWVTDATGVQAQFSATNSFSGVTPEPVSALRPWDVIAPAANGGASFTTYVKVSDAAGNSTTVGPVTVLIDTVAPTSPALSFAAALVSNTTVTANFSAANADWVELSEDISFLSKTVLTYLTLRPLPIPPPALASVNWGSG